MRVSQFSGEIPRLDARLLPDNYSQIAFNCKVENGVLVPIRRGKLLKTMPENCKTIYLDKEEWRGWPGLVDVVPAPIAEDRLYITGDGAPKIMIQGATYDLAVPNPNTSLVATITGEPDKDTQLTVLYGYTYLTQWDEESELSPLSIELLTDPLKPVVLSGFQTAPAGRGINRQRIYRSQTNTLGETVMYLIHERADSTSNFTDTPADYPLMESLPSADYNQPPQALKGLVAMPNGMMAAFVGKKVYFCEPYQPHAWPEKYILTVDFNVVGLGVFGSSLAIMTEGQPYVASGVTPDVMGMERLRVNLPCVSANTIVDLGYSVAYASHSGLVTIDQNGAQLVSQNLITRDQWRKMQPAKFIAGQYDGRYMAYYNYPGDTAGSEAIDGILIIDLTGSQPFIMRATERADAMFNAIGSGQLYLLTRGKEIYEWDSPSMPFGEMLWRSKKFVLPGHTNFGIILVEGEDLITEGERERIRAANQVLIDTEQTGGPIADEAMGMVTFAGSLLEPGDDLTTFGVSVISDKVVTSTSYEYNEPDRLSSGFLAKIWEFEIRGNLSVSAVVIVGSMEELASGQ